ncbi:putative membrane protein (TIGR02226 family) [Tumebacillus sp. BK434]|uniref:vWA domain-containing protein n=1 Tax=Tumebacillus sp. BK434 TaxID=2512169 RepID=UPI001048B86F|nr:VWA domain-containing protein [Tumebacillus sp. BK434]TCP59041.1 putative membrane protein (TIGR02226 family) [Tumebacillus sp. BK434]
MSWMSPWMLSFLAALPVIAILYLLKRTYEKVTVPSTLLWGQVLREMEANRPWQKLRRNLLLLLQLLLALLLALALARPALHGEGPVAEHTIIVLDLSPSMAAEGADGTRLEAGKKKVKDLIQQLHPPQRLTLIAMGQEPRVLGSGSDSNELLSRLDTAAQEYGKADYEGALSLAAALSVQEPESDVRIYSDGNWGIDPALLPKFGRKPTVETSDAAANLGIYHAAGLVSGTEGQLVATVKNDSAAAVTVEVEVLDSQGRVLDAKQVEIPAEGQAPLTWTRLPAETYYEVRLPGADGLEADNRVTVLPQVSTTKKVWLSTAGNVFLEKALGIGGNTTVERGADPDTPPQDADLYVYDGVLPKAWPSGAVLLINPPQGEGIFKTGGLLEPGKLQAVRADSPLLQHIELEKVHLKAVRQLDAPAWLQPVAKSGDAPLLLAGAGEGRRVAVLAFDLHQSDLPLLPSFPILIKQIKAYLAPASGTAIGQVTAGERVALLPPVREQGWTVTAPGGERTAVTSEMIELGFRPAEPGLYRFQGKTEHEVKLLAVTMPETESKLDAAKTALPTDTREEQGAKRQAESGQFEIWRYLALIALLVLFVEWGVYKRGI